MCHLRYGGVRRFSFRCVLVFFVCFLSLGPTIHNAYSWFTAARRFAVRWSLSYALCYVALKTSSSTTLPESARTSRSCRVVPRRGIGPAGFLSFRRALGVGRVVLMSICLFRQKCPCPHLLLGERVCATCRIVVLYAPAGSDCSWQFTRCSTSWGSDTPCGWMSDGGCGLVYRITRLVG